MSTLRTNALEGVDAKNSITIVAGAGNITTTNVQEGLAKAWINFNGTGTIATRDSFNVGSLTDNGTGDHTVTFANAFQAAEYAANVSSGQRSSYADAGQQPHTIAAASVKLVTFENNGNADSTIVINTNNGDLA